MLKLKKILEENALKLREDPRPSTEPLMALVITWNIFNGDRQTQLFRGFCRLTMKTVRYLIYIKIKTYFYRYSSNARSA